MTSTHIDIVSKFQNDAIDFKILAAKVFLDKIPQEVPLQVDVANRLQVEVNIQCFLFFSIGAIDLMYKKINEKLKLDIKPHSVRLSNINEKLNKQIDHDNSIAKRIQDDINLYNLEPTRGEPEQTTKEYANQYAEEKLGGIMGLDFWTRFENRNGVWFEYVWNRKNSSLWELRELRNTITHGNILKQSREQINKVSRDGIELKLKYDAKDHHDKTFILNPLEYFSESLNNVIKHIESISRILNELN